METLKIRILTVIIAFCCLTNVQAQGDVKGKLKGEIVKSSDTGMFSVDKDSVSNASSTEKKGLNAVNVKLARGIDKKDSRKNVGVNPDTISNSSLRKGWDGTVKGGKIDEEFASKKGYEYYKAKSDVKASKQTQGATFGEKVNQGLHQAGSAISQGASVQKDSASIPSTERAINESGVSVKSTKPKK